MGYVARGMLFPDAWITDSDLRRLEHEAEHWGAIHEDDGCGADCECVDCREQDELRFLD